jgi:nitrate/nitrite transporter NarK
VGVLANQFGTAVGLGSTCFLDFCNSNAELSVETLRPYLGIQLGAAALALFLTFVTVSDRPPAPPSLAASMVSDPRLLPVHKDIVLSEDTTLLNDSRVKKLAPTYLESLQLVFRNSLSFVLVFGLSVGVYYTIPAFLSQLMPLSSKKSGWLGVLYQLSGVVGSFLSGLALDRFQHHRSLCLMLLSGTLLSFITLIFTTQYRLAIFGVGFCLAAINAVGLELGTAMTYPASEAAVAGILECAAELGGFLLVTIGTSLPFIGNGFLGLLCGAISFAMIMLCFTRAKSKRPQ